MQYLVYGLKLAKREPLSDFKTGEIFDDGANHQIVLCRTEIEELRDFFFKNIKARIHGKSWKIWKENLK